MYHPQIVFYHCGHILTRTAATGSGSTDEEMTQHLVCAKESKNGIEREVHMSPQNQCNSYLFFFLQNFWFINFYFKIHCVFENIHLIFTHVCGNKNKAKIYVINGIRTIRLCQPGGMRIKYGERTEHMQKLINEIYYFNAQNGRNV